MNKAELIEKIAEETGISKAQAAKVLNAALKAISESLAAGDEVSLPGFGTFSVGARAARVGRNPQTGAAIKIKESRVPKFKAGKSLKTGISPTGGGGPGEKITGGGGPGKKR